MQKRTIMRLLRIRLSLQLMLALIKFIKIKMRRLQKYLQSIRFQMF
jgi:hypothetical protein